MLPLPIWPATSTAHTRKPQKSSHYSKTWPQWKRHRLDLRRLARCHQPHRRQVSRRRLPRHLPRLCRRYDLRTPETVQSTLSAFDKTVGMTTYAPCISTTAKHPSQATETSTQTSHWLPRSARLPRHHERPTRHRPPHGPRDPIDVRDENGILQKDAKGKDMEDKSIWPVK